MVDSIGGPTAPQFYNPGDHAHRTVSLRDTQLVEKIETHISDIIYLGLKDPQNYSKQATEAKLVESKLTMAKEEDKHTIQIPNWIIDWKD